MKTNTLLVFCLFSLLISGCGPKGMKVKADRLIASPDPVYYDFAGGSSSSCGSAILRFEFFWPIDADLDSRYDPPAKVELYLSWTLPSKSSPDAGKLVMAAPSSIISEPYTTSINMTEMASDYGFGGAEFTIEFYVKATGNYHASDFDKEAKGILQATIFETDKKSIKVWPCLPKPSITLEPGQFTLTPSLTPIPSETPTTTLTPTRQPTKEKEPTKQPKEEEPAPPAPPSCSVEPNNPNCVP